MSGESEPWSGGALEARFAALTAFVRQRHIWGPRPFTSLRLPWEEDHPRFAAWLRGLTIAQARSLEADPLGPASEGAPAELLRWARQRERLVALGPAPRRAVEALTGPRVRWRVPGRKWAQVKALIGVAAAAWPEEATEVVEWCAGHGHLGRTLAHHAQVPALLLERQGGQASRAEELAARLGAAARFVEADVLRPESWEHLRPGVVAVGLHACGVLNATLLAEGARRGVARLVVAPCCPHQTGSEGFVPWSEAGRRVGLRWDKSALRLSIADEAVATPGEVARRGREQAWRLGLDLLVREATGEDRYWTVGMLPAGALRGGFEAFCRAQAARRGLPLPPRWDAAKAERAGWERARVARGLGVARSLFRRPLELWLALDRALMVREAGRPVTVGTFCAMDQTPRNVVIVS